MCACVCACARTDAYGEVIHPETAFYPHITKSRIPLDQLLADTGSSLEQGLVLGTTTRSQLTDESSRFVDQLRTVPGAATGLGAALSQVRCCIIQSSACALEAMWPGLQTFANAVARFRAADFLNVIGRRGCAVESTESGTRDQKWARDDAIVI